MEGESNNQDATTVEEVSAYEENKRQRALLPPPRPAVNAAPNPSPASRVKVLALMSSTASSATATSSATTALVSTSLQQKLTKQQGPFSKDPLGPAETSRGKVGEVEHNIALDEVAFDINRKQFQTKGMALAPDGFTIVKEKGHYRPVPNLFSHDGQSLGHTKRQKIMELNAQKPLLVEGSDDEATYGIWGPPTPHELQEKMDSRSDMEAGNPLLPEQVAERAYMEERRRKRGIQEEEEGGTQQQQQQQQFDRLVERKMAHLLPPRLSEEEAKPIEPSTKFHGAAEYDYKGLPWTTPPATGVRPYKFGDLDHHRCYVPKKCVHRFTGREFFHCINIIHFMFALQFVFVFIFGILNIIFVSFLFLQTPKVYSEFDSSLVQVICCYLPDWKENVKFGPSRRNNA